MKTNCTKKEVGVRGSMKRWALMKLKSWNSLSSSLVLHAKVVSNRCVHVTVTIIISLRSCYNWQQLCGAVVRGLARQWKGGGGWQDGGCSGSSGNLRRGACLNLGHLPVYMGLGDRATPPPNWKHMCCTVYSPELIALIMFVPPKKKELKTNKYTDPMKPGAVGHAPGGGGTCHHGRSTSNCFKW